MSFIIVSSRPTIRPSLVSGGDVTPPTVVSSTINSDGTSLTIAFSESVVFGAGGNGGLTITPSGGGATLTYLSGSGTSSLVYTISRTILSTETVTRTYVQPGNGIEDVAGNDLVSFTTQSVTNNSTQTSSGNLFFDDFSSGNFNKQLNGANFWEENTNCAVISGFSSAGNSGNCVRFNFDIGAMAVSELRYNLGNQFSQVWFKMRLFYPLGSESPTRGPKAQLAGNNNKFFRCWADSPTGSANGFDPRFGASYYATSPTGDAEIGAQAGIFPVSEPGSTSQIPFNTPQYFALVNDTYRGTWVTIEFRFKASSGAGANNGEWQCWRNGVQTNLITGLDSYNAAGTYTGMRKGYVQGAQDVPWTNSGTAMYMDYFSVSTTGRAT